MGGLKNLKGSVLIVLVERAQAFVFFAGHIHIDASLLNPDVCDDIGIAKTYEIFRRQNDGQAPKLLAGRERLQRRQG